VFGVEISPSEGGKLQPPLKVVITTLLFTVKSGTDQVVGDTFRVEIVNHFIVE